MVILVLSGSSTSSLCLFRGNSWTFPWSGMVLNVFLMVRDVTDLSDVRDVVMLDLTDV